MITRFCPTLRLRLALSATLALLPALQAQPFPATPAPHSAADAKNLPPVPVLIPPAPTLKSPVELFRDLLAMKPAAREKDLAARPPEIRKRILAKLQEYEAMNPADREVRLRVTQLRWYLLSFLDAPADKRAAQLAMVPPKDRQLVNDRLQQWDQLPADEQKEILKYEKTMEQFAGQSLDGATATNHVIAGVPPSAARQNDLNNLDNFLKLPLEQRHQTYASFQRFFELTDAEKQKTLGTLPVSQRLPTVNALRNLSRLSGVQREQYLNAFGKFSSMNDVERQEFVKNAAQWRALPPAERQAWRTLVNRLPPQPPMPPGVAFPPMPPQPSPPLPPLQASALPTNSP